MDLGGAIQGEMLARFLVWAGIVWVVIAICVGLWASEMKKRPFWLWVVLSLVIGPIAWYFILFRLGIHIPPELRMACPKCGKTISQDARVCRYCKAWVKPESQDRAAEIGKQAATAVFAARHLLGRTRKAAEKAAEKAAGPRRNNGTH